MTKLLKWLLPKKVDVPEIKPVLLSDVDAALTPHTELEQEVQEERRKFAVEVNATRRSAQDMRLALTKATLVRHARGLN